MRVLVVCFLEKRHSDRTAHGPSGRERAGVSEEGS